MKTLPVEVELFHADGQADRRTDRHDEANSHFSQFCTQKMHYSLCHPQKTHITTHLLPVAGYLTVMKSMDSALLFPFIASNHNCHS